MVIPKSEWIWHNGAFVKWNAAIFHVAAHGRMPHRHDRLAFVES